MSSRATADAYLGVEIPLPDGRVVTCKALPLKRGVYWAKLQAIARMEPDNGEGARLQAEAQVAIMEDFPREVAPDDNPDAFEGLLPAETYELLDRFLAFQRPAVIEAMNPKRTKTMGRSSTSGSMT